MDNIWLVVIIGILIMIAFTVGITNGMMNLQSDYDTCLSVIESGNNTQSWIENECEWYKNNIGGAFR